jgi:hypothetical protein
VAGRIRSIEKSNDIENRTRDLPPCTIVPCTLRYRVPPQFSRYNLSLRLINHHKTYGGVEVELHALLTSAKVGGTEFSKRHSPKFERVGISVETAYADRVTLSPSKQMPECNSNRPRPLPSKLSLIPPPGAIVSIPKALLDSPLTPGSLYPRGRSPDIH